MLEARISSQEAELRQMHQQASQAEALQSQIHSFKAKNDMLRDLTERNEELGAELETSRRKASELVASCEYYKKTTEDTQYKLEKQAISLGEEQQRQADMQHSYGQRIRDLSETHNALQKEIVELRSLHSPSHREEEDKARETLEASNRILRDSVTEQNDRLKLMEEQLQELERTLDHKSAAYSELEYVKEMQASKIKELEASFNDRQDSMKEDQIRSQELSSQLEERSNQLHEANSKLESYQIQLEDMSSRFAQSENDSVLLRSGIQEASQRFTTTHSRVAELEEALKSQFGKRRRIWEGIEVFVNWSATQGASNEETIAKYRTQIDETMQLVVSKTASISSLEAELTATHEVLNENTAQAKERLEQHDRLSTELHETRSQLRNAENLLQETREALSVQQKSNQDQIASLRELITEKDTIIQSNEAETTTLQAELERLGVTLENVLNTSKIREESEKEKLIKFETEVADLNKQLADAEHKQNMQTAIITQTHAETIQKLEQAHRETAEEAAVAKSELVRLHTETEESRNAIRIMTEKLKTSQVEAATLAGALEEMREEHAAVENQSNVGLENLKTNISELQEALSKSKNENSILSEQVNDLTTQLSKLIENASSIGKDAETEKINLRKLLESNEAEVNRLSDENATLLRDREALTAQSTHSAEQVSDLEQVISNLQSQITLFEKEHQNLTEEVGKLFTAKQTLEKEVIVSNHY